MSVVFIVFFMVVVILMFIVVVVMFIVVVVVVLVVFLAALVYPDRYYRMDHSVIESLAIQYGLCISRRQIQFIGSEMSNQIR